MVVTGIALIAGCEDQIDILAPPEFIPVVYCLLDPDQDVQKLRISRVFQESDPKKISDPLVNSYKVWMESRNENNDRELFNFYYVTERTERFQNQTHITHLFESEMKPERTTVYQLYVYFPELNKMVSGTTKTVGDVSIIDPAIVPGREIVLHPYESYTFRWSTGQSSSYYQGVIRINYLEKENHEISSKSVDLVMRPILTEPDLVYFNQNLTGIGFLNNLKENIPIISVVERKLISLDYSLYHGGYELMLFSQAAVNPNAFSNMTSDYSNLDNGRGVFSSLTALSVNNLSFAEQTIDTLAFHPLTKSLNFISSDEDF